MIYLLRLFTYLKNHKRQVVLSLARSGAEIGSNIGSFVGSVGQVVGMIVGFVIGLIAGFIIEAMKDDIFPPAHCSISVPSLTSGFSNGNERTPLQHIGFEGHNGEYLAKVFWELSR